MFNKIKNLFGSIRFWTVTLIMFTTLLQIYTKSGIDLMAMIEVVKIWLGVVAGIGTMDSVVTKLGESLRRKK